MVGGPVPAWRGWLALASLTLGLGLVGLALAPARAAGVSWTPLTALPISASQHPMLWQLAADPRNPRRLVAATSQGVFASSDQGTTWQATSMRDFTWTVAFASSGTLLAGTDHAGVQRSTDGGQNWAADNAGLKSLDVRAIAVGPTAIVLGTQGGVYLGGNGAGWEQVGLTTVSISSVAIVANSPLGVVAGSDGQVAPSNLYRSLGVGSAGGWQPLPGGDPGGAPVFAVAAGPLAQGASSPPLLVGSLKGLYASPDGGNSWQARTLGQGALWSVNTIAFDPENPAVVYVGGDNGGSSGGGLQRSLDGGSSWTRFKQGLPASDVEGLSALGTNPLTVLAALWSPTRREPAAALLLDTSAPGPVALQSATGTPIAVNVSPLPTSPARHHHQGTSGQKSGSLPAWLIPVVVVALLLAALVVYLLVQRRRRRLDAEAPP
ncbi:MAG: hypothetical protein ACREOD_01320 [Candidatus Dormibacteria bacterium]